MRYFRRPSLFSVLIAGFGLAAPAIALDPSRAVTQYRIDAWHVGDGLPQESVRTIAETSDGFLWLGTQFGLARFDGADFRVFTSSNSPALNGRDHILALCADPTGGLWIATAGSGLVYAKN